MTDESFGDWDLVVWRGRATVIWGGGVGNEGLAVAGVGGA